MQEEEFNTPEKPESEQPTPETPQQETPIPEEKSSAPEMEQPQVSQMTPPTSPATSGKLPGLGSLFGRTFQIYGENFSKFFVLSLVFILLIYGSVILSTAIFGGGVALGVLSGSDAGLLASIGIMGVLYVLAIIFISGYFSAALMAGLIYILKGRENKKSFGEIFGETFSFAFKKGFAIWWITILFGFLVGGSTFLLVVPGIMFFVWFLFGEYSYVYEGKGGMKSLMNSRDLVKGYWWPAFGRTLVLLLILIGLALVVAFIAPDSKTVTNVINIVETLIVSPFVVVFYGLLYEDLKKAKVGQEIPESTAGRKAKYLLTALAGLIVGIVLIVLLSLNLAKKVKDLDFDEEFTFPTTTSQDSEMVPEITE